MKNVNQMGKRFLALLIAVVMIVGQIPFGAVATEENAVVEPVTSFKKFYVEMTIKKVETQVEVTPSAPSIPEGSESTDESTEAETPSESQDAQAPVYETVISYEYTGTAYDMDKNQLGAVEFTDAEGNVLPADENGKVAVENEVLTGSYTYNGMVLKTTIGASDLNDEGTGEKTVTWEAKLNWGDVYAGAAFTFPGLPALSEGASVAEGYEWEASRSGSYTEAEGKYYADKTGGAVTIAYALKSAENSYTVVESTKTIATAPTVTTELQVAGQPQVLYGSVEEANQNIIWSKTPVSVKAVANTGVDLKDEPAVTTNVGTWIKDASDVKVWSASADVEANKTAAFELNDQYLTVGVETEKPTVTIEKTYNHKGENKGDRKTTVEFTYTVGISGVDSFLINGQAYTLAELNDMGDGKYSVTLDRTKEVSVVVNSVAGNSSDEQGASAQDDLNVTFAYTQGEKYQGIGADKWVYDPSGIITITVTGTDASTYIFNTNSAVTALNAAGNAISATEWKANADQTRWTCTVSTEEGLKSLSVIPSDAIRTGEEFPYTEYQFGVDITAPAGAAVSTNVEADKVENGVSYYEEKSVTYAVSVQENLLNVKDSYITYSVVGREPTKVSFADSNNGTYVANFTVPTGSKLTGITVHAVDKAGNVYDETIVRNDKIDNDAPVVTFSISENVKQFYTNDDQIFAVLDPSKRGENPTEENETEIVILTATVTDMSIETMDEGWSCTTNQYGANVWTKEFKAEVAKDSSGQLAFTVDVKDIFNKVPQGNAAIELDYQPTNDKYKATVDLAPVDGVYSYIFKIDRRTPDNISSIVQAPEITLIPSETPSATSGGLELYNGGESGTITFSMNVDDLYVVEIDSETNEIIESSNDSGIDDLSLDAVINCNDFLSVDKSKLDENGAATITVILNGINETNEAQLKVTLADEVGNTYTYVKNFAVDNKAPEIVIEYGEEVPQNDYYYNAPRTAKISVYDLNLDAASAAVQFNDWITALNLDVTGTTAIGEVVMAEEGHYTLSVFASDLAGAEYIAGEGDYIGNTPTDFYVDLNNPEFTITKVDAEGAACVQEDDTTEYYNGKVTYTISLEDTYLAESKVTYTKINAANESVTDEVSLGNGESVTIEVNNGEILTDIQLYALDLSGRYACEAEDVVSDIEFTYDAQSYIWTYNGKDVAVDETPATVTVTKTIGATDDALEGKFVQEYDGYDYYNDALTYNVDIIDRFLNDLEESEIMIQVLYQGSNVPVTFQLGEEADFNVIYDEKTGNEIYSTRFTVEDGQCVEDITIQVIDNAGNVTREINTDDAERTGFDFSNAEGINNYNGKPTIVDMTNPKATLTVGGNVEQFYTFNGVAYVKLVNPGEGMSGALSGQKDETVTLTIQVNDKNFTLNSENVYPVKNNTSNDATNWSGTEQKNADTTLTYFDQITVAADKTGYFKFDLTVYDLAGHAITADDITVTDINNTSLNNLKTMVAPNNGKFGTTISVDRRRPSTVTGDNDAPVINIQPSIGFTTSNNDRELYAGAFSFALTVTDGTNDASNSGLNSVDWIIEDPVGFIAPANVVNGQEEGTYTQNFNIPVALAQENGESNSVKLTITATDNVGNTTTYIKEFAVDNLAPRVTVSYDNNSVLNAKYFKADRVASIRVEDINFNAATTPITTEVTPSAWTQTDDVYTATCAYTVDGEYTFDMSATDKAGNVSEIDFTNGGRNAAPKEFTLDKTAPVINVSYNPGSPIGNDPQGVQYYDQDLGVTVTITEVNFNGSEVQAEMGARNALSFWSNNGDRHTASTSYAEGNNYSFTIQYTDLAGNAATAYTSPTFSVDTHAPTIVVSEGDLTNEELNIVQDDLVLGFTINDEQQNLRDYSVKVTHLNNEFKETVVEGADYYIVSEGTNRTTVYVDFTAIEAIKENDGTYNVQITASDYAGHIVSLTPSLSFSLNRFGSTFMTDDEFTANFLEPSADGTVYQSAVSNKLVIKEINPNKVWQDESKKVEGSVITIAVNGQSIILEKDVDYTVTLTEQGSGSNKWYVYTYEIDPANFVDGEELIDGNYTVLLYGIDEAGNKNTNESNEYGNVQKDNEGNYSGKIEFTLDHKAPVITTYGVETGDSIDAESKQLNINLSDNTPASVKVLVNGVEVVLSESMEGLSSDQLWLALNEETGEYVLNIPESNEKRSITIITTDAAGNTAEQVIDDVLITSNWFIRAINNPVIVGCTGAGFAGLIAFIFFLLKKKKNKEEQPA